MERCCRHDVSDVSMNYKHLYDHDDILSFENGDAINENLREKDGWFGFYNTTVIPSKDSNGNDIDISRAINNKGNCEFIDMYPDRSLFSFVPKVNNFKKRLEYNWDIELTYPFDSCVTDEDGNDILLIQDGDVNALYVSSVKYMLNHKGMPILLFRTFTKHNLKKNDYVRLYFNCDTESNGNAVTWIRTSNTYLVNGVGDMDNNNKEYYFYISNSDLLDEIFATQRNKNYTVWDYVRDNFYVEFNGFIPSGSNFVEYASKYQYTIRKGSGLLSKKITVYKQIIEGVVVYTLEEHISESYTVVAAIKTEDGSIVYAQGYTDLQEHELLGLTNVPTSNDACIMIDGKRYVLCDKDTGETYFDVRNTMSVDEFIRRIINNAFKADSNIERPTNSPSWTEYIQFRVAKAEGDIDCQYYVRKFKKIPNVKNGVHGYEDRPFKNEYYRVGYADTIYGDPCVQLTYTDTIHLSGLTDNLGRPISEIFATIVKSNRGHNEWYSEDGDLSNVEFSHCFGNVTCGFDVFSESDDSVETKIKRHQMCDVTLINNNNISFLNYDNTNNMPKTIGNKTDIKIDDEWFYGDIVEFNPVKYTETVICDVNFRFNTAQRELDLCYPTYYDEIVQDDFDKEIDENDIFGKPKRFVCKKETLSNWTLRPEGYYYKPHYPFKLKAFGELRQDTHKSVNVTYASPIQLNGMYIKIYCFYQHNVTTNDSILLIDSANNVEWKLSVVHIIDKYSFVIDKISKSDANYKDWITICNGINYGDYKIRLINTNIPDYAVKIHNCTYIWRDMIGPWESDSMNEFVFANGAFYIDESINFHLRRQDPEGVNGLYVYDDIYSGPEGIIEPIDLKYDYKKESDFVC